MLGIPKNEIAIKITLWVDRFILILDGAWESLVDFRQRLYHVIFNPIVRPELDNLKNPLNKHVGVGAKLQASRKLVDERDLLVDLHLLLLQDSGGPGLNWLPSQPLRQIHHFRPALLPGCSAIFHNF